YGLVGAHGMHRGVDRHGRVAAAAAVLARADAADAADMRFLSVPGYGAEVDADMADQTILGRLDQNAQIGMGPFDVAPRQLLDDVRSPHRLMQRLRDRPRRAAVQDVDFDAHRFRRSAPWP